MHATVTSAGALRALGQRFTDEVLNAHDTGAAMDELVAEDFVEQNPLPGQGPGRAGLAGVLTAMFTAFPDLRWTLRDTIVEDDRIMTLSTWTGTHRVHRAQLAPEGHFQAMNRAIATYWQVAATQT